MELGRKGTAQRSGGGKLLPAQPTVQHGAVGGASGEHELRFTLRKPEASSFMRLFEGEQLPLVIYFQLRVQ